MTQEEFLAALGIKGKKSIEADKIIVETNDSNLYSAWYSILDKSDLVDLDPEATVIDMNEAKLTFIGDEYQVTILGDLENNVYKLLIEEL